jgi:hypothetical protein
VHTILGCERSKSSRDFEIRCEGNELCSRLAAQEVGRFFQLREFEEINAEVFGPFIHGRLSAKQLKAYGVLTALTPREELVFI